MLGSGPDIAAAARDAAATRLTNDEVLAAQQRARELFLAAGALGHTILQARIAAANVAQGEAAAVACAGCHTFGQGEGPRFGPNLYDIVAALVGRSAGFAYTAGMQALNAEGAIWTYDRLDTFLTSPAAMVPGTGMFFAGIPAEQDRANVIAYLRSLSATPAALLGTPVATEAPTSYRLAPASATVNEGAGAVTFTLTRSGGILPAETLLVSTAADQGAVNNGDFTAFTNQAVAFSAGQATQTIRFRSPTTRRSRPTRDSRSWCRRAGRPSLAPPSPSRSLPQVNRLGWNT